MVPLGLLRAKGGPQHAVAPGFEDRNGTFLRIGAHNGFIRPIGRDAKQQDGRMAVIIDPRLHYR